MLPQRLRLEQLAATSSGRGWANRPYSPVSGFRANWWQQTPAGTPRDWFRFLDHGHEELVRVEIKPHSDAGYEGVNIPSAGFAEITYLEVRDDRRDHDYGSEAIRLLSDFYKGRHLAAFSEQADGFWPQRSCSVKFWPIT